MYWNRYFAMQNGARKALNSSHEAPLKQGPVRAPDRKQRRISAVDHHAMHRPAVPVDGLVHHLRYFPKN